MEKAPRSEYLRMSRIATREVIEAEDLLEEVQSWSKDEVMELPEFYREKAEEYRRLSNPGDS